MIHRLTGGQPFLAQYLAKSLVESMNAERINLCAPTAICTPEHLLR